jgi:hypothetical protein
MQNDQRSNLQSTPHNMVNIMSSSDKQSVTAHVKAGSDELPSPTGVMGKQWEGVPNRVWKRTGIPGTHKVPAVWIGLTTQRRGMLISRHK